MSDNIIFTLCYLLLTICIICPPTEFVSAGISLQALFSRYLGSEHQDFIKYHIRKSMLNVLVFSLLPIGYITLLILFGYTEELQNLFIYTSLIGKLFFTTSVILPITALIQLKIWSGNNYINHPIVINLERFQRPWSSLAGDINREFRNIDKICINTSSITKIIATENWILKVTPLNVHMAHQSDTRLTVKEANTYHISHQNTSEVQFLNIEVKSSRPNVVPFDIRINATDFKDLQDRVTRTITILPNVKFHKTVIEQFVDIFKETVQQNPKYEVNEDYEQCIGCLQAAPSIKLRKMCTDAGQNNCTNCYCRPMWCLECIAKWFASRQDSEHQNQWLSSKSTCPMCRSTFCILDVCVLEHMTN